LRAPSIARNYAEALFTLGEHAGRTAEYAELIEAVALAIGSSPQVEAVLVSPRVPKAAKADLLARALPGAPMDFVRFLQSVVRRGRQALFGEIAEAYQALLDVQLNRVHASVIVAREPNAELRETIREALATALGKDVVPEFAVDPEILGGTIVRVGEQVYDGSVRRRMTRWRRQLVR
jgi:F-type H+-transporting ATPase subunit delta